LQKEKWGRILEIAKRGPAYRRLKPKILILAGLMDEWDEKISGIGRFSGENTYSPPFLLPLSRGICGNVPTNQSHRSIFSAAERYGSHRLKGEFRKDLRERKSCFSIL
jgi:hypothetical protein